MAVLGVYFQHLYTGVNGVGKREVNIPRFVVYNPPGVAHVCSPKSDLMTLDMPLQPPFTDSFLSSV